MADNLKKFDTNDILNQSEDMKSYIEELVSKLRNDADVYEKIKPLGLTMKEVRDNIGKLADFQEDYNICKNCKGLKNCPKQIKYASMYVYKDGNYITTRSEPCSKFIEKAKLDAKYLFSDFPEEWKTSTLKDLDLSENRRPLIKEFVNIAKGNSSRWLYAIGNHKVGKSHLLVTFANEFIALGLGHVAVIDATTKFKELADIAYSDKEGFKAQIDALSNVPLLVIDNFGQEYKNEFMRDQIVLPVLSERNNKNKLTFFSSEFKIYEVQKLYSVGKNGGEIRGKQLGNLLTEMCEKEFDLTGASIYKK